MGPSVITTYRNTHICTKNASVLQPSNVCKLTLTRMAVQAAASNLCRHHGEGCKLHCGKELTTKSGCLSL